METVFVRGHNRSRIIEKIKKEVSESSSDYPLINRPWWLLYLFLPKRIVLPLLEPPSQNVQAFQRNKKNRKQPSLNL